VEPRFERHAVPDVRERERGHARRAVHLDAFEHTFECSGRIQDSGNPVEDAKVRVLETVRRRQRRLGRLFGLPGPECPFRLDAARRRWIGEVRAE
jgi:hypothetical protein